MEGDPQLLAVAVEVEPCFPAGSMKVEEFVDEVVHFTMAAGYGRHLGGASELGSELSQLEFGVILWTRIWFRIWFSYAYPASLGW